MTSTIKVNTVTTESGSTLTLGESGKTVTLASGASQTGFGRTGTVDWQTSIKTSTITAVNGEGYFVNTTGGAITANLPAGTAGSIVAFKDYLGTFDNNALTIAANGSQKINGDATIDLIVDTEGESITLVYADDTQGWLVVNDGNTDAGSQAQFISASGGNTVANSPCGNFKIHTFTGPGTFTVCSVGNAAGSNTVSYVVVAAGGGGGGSNNANISGGGGAGGYREGLGSNDSYGGSPLRNPTGLPVSVQGYPITVGAGGGGGPQGAGCASRGGSGNTSIFSSITSAGGGGGGNGSGGVPSRNGIPGGSGGGGAGGGPAPTGSPGGTGNTPPVSPPQGNDGGKGGYFSPDQNAAGGGGAGAVGQDAQPPATSGAGGAGTTSTINGGPVIRAGGGGGAEGPSKTGGAGGPGGGGAGSSSYPGSGAAGTANTGGGGGGSGDAAGAAGGSGIVIIRYKFH